MTEYNISLTFPGTCAEAFNLYKKVFRQDFNAFILFSDDPTTSATFGITEKELDMVAFVEMRLGNIRLYGDDTLPSSGTDITPGKNVSISVDTETREEADRIFKELSEGGEVLTPPTDFSWGYISTFIDKYGVKWVTWYKPPREG